MSVLGQIRRFKLSFIVYNFLNQRKLKHNLIAYKKFKLKKWLFSSVSSKDFFPLEQGDLPWLDNEIREVDFLEKLKKSKLSEKVKPEIIQWKNQGYVILRSFFSNEVCDSVNKEIESLFGNHKVELNTSGKIMFANKKSELIRNITFNPELTDILEFILGDEIIPFQTINFIQGSEQEAHSDSIHMTTHPKGYLIAAWIALEDISEDQGPLSFYPGSHKLPYLMNTDYERGGTNFTLGSNGNYRCYEKKIAELIKNNNLDKKIFTAKKGDVLIWHANLIHGGEVILKENTTRKSMVIHFFGKHAIKYHEISERPALI